MFFQDLFPRYPPRPNDGSQPAPYWAWDGSLGLGVLPPGLFASGHAWFVGDLPTRYRLKPYTVHGGSGLGPAAGPGLPPVRARLRAAGVWNDPEQYFAPGERLLQLTVAPPPDLMDLNAARSTAAGEAPLGHLGLVAWQLDALRDGFALAEARAIGAGHPLIRAFLRQ